MTYSDHPGQVMGGIAVDWRQFTEQPDPGDTIPDEPNDPVEEPEPEGEPE